MYWNPIITFLIWPVLILVTYWLVMLAINKLEQSERRKHEKSG
jgi:hypothetical protein